MGGVVPLGYRVDNRKLLVDEAEADTVRLIFDRYRALRSLPALQRDLRERGIVTRIRHLVGGRTIGGVPLTNGPLVSMLRNRTYIGEINHRDQSYPGAQEPIVERAVFDAVQAILDGNRRGRRERWASSEALLLGKLFDDRGNRMTPSYAIKKGVRYRYYISSVLAQGRKDEAGSVARVAANEIERRVRDALSAGERRPANHTDSDLRDRIDRVVLSATEVTILLASRSEPCDPIRVAWTPPRSTRHHAVIPVAQPATSPLAHQRRSMKGEQRAKIVVAIAKARRWRDQIVSGDLTDLDALAVREGRGGRSIRMMLSLAFLAPDIVEAAVDGSLPPGLNLTDLTDLSMVWAEQRAALGLPPRS